MASAGGAAGAYVYLKQRTQEKGEKKVRVNARKWECVQLGHHNEVGKKIEEWENNGWVLHTYTTASFQSTVVNHYLLFFKEE